MPRWPRARDFHDGEWRQVHADLLSLDFEHTPGFLAGCFEGVHAPSSSLSA
jgi:hypothetical protein